MEEKRVLAMYDVRGKQSYIYRGNRIKEIIGASAVIRDVFRDYLYPAAREVRDRELGPQEGEAIYCYDAKEGEAFSPGEFEERMAGTQYLGEIVYDGGGNFLVLYRNKELCIAINKSFTKRLMVETYTLKTLCTLIELEDQSLGDFKGDRERLYAKHRENEARESVIYPVNSLPIVQVDPQTSRPLSAAHRVTGAGGAKPEKMSRERLAKYLKYEKEKGDGENILDKIVTEKGKESLLAVVYIDGNNMGQQVQECLRGKASYGECVTELRRFSEYIQKNYVGDRLAAINACLDEKYRDRKRRTIVAAGDEMTFLCNARDALCAVEAYFKGLPEGCSSCAGIAVFHSHAPYADAYRLAEECCESGKDRMKEDGLSNACFLDFHYCQGVMGISLEQIRDRELEGEVLSRPWLLYDTDETRDAQRRTGRAYTTLAEAKEMARLFRRMGRSNVKTLLDAARYSQSEMEMELLRINAHREDKLDFTLGGKLGPERKRSLIYDMVLIYDLWFAKEEEGKDGQEETGMA